jgi:hypothetical protein
MLPGQSGLFNRTALGTGTVHDVLSMKTLHPLHARFLLLLPRIEAHAKIYFRDTVCAAKRVDNVAETIAMAWKWFARLDERGKDAAQFVTTLANLAGRAVKCGRAWPAWKRPRMP